MWHFSGLFKTLRYGLRLFFLGAIRSDSKLDPSLGFFSDVSGRRNVPTVPKKF